MIVFRNSRTLFSPGGRRHGIAVQEGGSSVAGRYNNNCTNEERALWIELSKYSQFNFLYSFIIVNKPVWIFSHPIIVKGELQLKKMQKKEAWRNPSFDEAPIRASAQLLYLLNHEFGIEQICLFFFFTLGIWSRIYELNDASCKL